MKKREHGRQTGTANKGKRDNVRVCLVFPARLWEDIKRCATATDQSACRLIRAAVAKVVADTPKQEG
jgi:hypothetical protein